MAATPPSSSSATTVPWWAWPQTLSLEAPIIAATWMAALANVHGVRLPPSTFWALALTVWVIYLLDRLIDARSASPDTLSQRHRICLQHQNTILFGVLPAISLILLWLALFRLPERLFWNALTITPLLIIYLVVYVAKFRTSTLLSRWVSKEVAGGVLFALGTTCGLWFYESRASLPIILFETTLLSCFFTTDLLANTIAEHVPPKNPPRSATLLFRLCIGLPLLSAAVILAAPDLLPSPLPQITFLFCGAALAASLLSTQRLSLSATAYRSLSDLILFLAAMALWLGAS